MSTYEYYWIFLIISSIIWVGTYFFYRYIWYKNNRFFYISEIFWTFFILIWSLILANIYFSEVVIWGMNWWMAFLVITGVITWIPMIFYEIFFSNKFPYDQIYFELDWNNFKKALKLYEIRKETIEKFERKNIYISIIHWMLYFWIDNKKEKKIKEAILLIEKLLKNKWENKNNILLVNKIDFILLNNDLSRWYSSLWNYKKSNALLEESLKITKPFLLKFDIVSAILSNNINFKKIEESKPLIEKYLKKLPKEKLNEYEDISLTLFLQKASLVYEKLWDNKKAIELLEKSKMYLAEDCLDKVYYDDWEIDSHEKILDEEIKRLRKIK